MTLSKRWVIVMIQVEMIVAPLLLLVVFELFGFEFVVDVLLAVFIFMVSVFVRHAPEVAELLISDNDIGEDRIVMSGAAATILLVLTWTTLGVVATGLVHLAAAYGVWATSSLRLAPFLCGGGALVGFAIAVFKLAKAPAGKA